MDLITQLAYALNSGWLAALNLLIDNDAIYLFILLAVVLLGERRPQKFAKIIFALVLALLVGYAIKNAFAIERPCVSLSLPYCPNDYSFPSLHALTAFVVMIAFLNKKSYWFYSLFALFISFTRLSLAVHSFRDIAGSLALALIVYHIADISWSFVFKEVNSYNEKNQNHGNEKNRQFFHIFVGLAALALLLIYGRGFLMAATFFILIFGLLFVNLAYLGKRNFLIDWFIRNFERKEVRFPGWGSACYATGVLLLTTFLTNPSLLAASLIVVALGDGASTLIGMKGKIPLPYNKKKTVEGTLAFFFFSLPSWFFIGPIAIAISAAAAFVESLPLPLDDNISVPLALAGILLFA